MKLTLFSGPKGPPGLREQAGATGATSVRDFPGLSGVPGAHVDSGPAGPAGSASQPGPRGLPGSPELVGATGKYHWLLQVPLLSAVCLSLCLSVRPSINTTLTRMRYSKSL